MTLEESIKYIRWQLRLTQKELAEQLGVTQAAISAYEVGIRKPHYNFLLEIDAFAKQNKVKVKLL